MNWSKIAIAGVIGGVVHTLANWAMHSTLTNAYMEHSDVFTQEEAGVHWFFIIGILVGVMACVLFAKTRGAWADGLKGGATYGFHVGLVIFFLQFYPTLVIDGFPYHLSWCWGGIDLIGFTILGAVLGALYKE